LRLLLLLVDLCSLSPGFFMALYLIFPEFVRYEKKTFFFGIFFCE